MQLVRNKARDEAVSVVIPAFNEEEEIRECLESLRQRSFPYFEVIVVDNGSKDATASIARTFGIHVIEERECGIARARQTGFEAAHGKVIASTDADTVVPPDWVSGIQQAFAQDPALWAVFGPIRLKRGSSPDPCVNHLLPFFERVGVDYHHGTAVLGLPQFFGANFAVQREAFVRVGGFRSLRDGHYYRRSEDIQLGLKLHRAGKIRFLEDLAVWTSARKLDRHLWWIPISNVRDYFSFFVRGKEV
ncbi:MAG: glycosyltransferase family 2 protein [Candidatus Bipolaricaulota bacterium]|nr:glycosyltransferase family 2 protein [Candidatus Bipolaricaulota bacterium]